MDVIRFVVRSSVVSVLILLVLCAVPFSAPAGAADPPLRIGIIPFYTPEKIFALYSPFIDYLNRTTQYRWELVVGDTHPELMDRLARSDVSIAMLGPIPFAQVMRRVSIRPLLITLTPTGETHYHSILVTADPDVHAVGDLKDRVISIFQGSTAAHFLPLAMLAEEGIDVEPNNLHRCISQDRIVTCLLNREAAAGGIKEALFRKLSDPRLRVLKTSRPLPQFVFAGSPALSQDAANSFITVLLSLTPLVNQADRDAMKGWDIELVNGFAPPGKDFAAEAETLLRSVERYVK